MILQLPSALALLAAPHGNDAENLSPDVEATLRYSEQLYDLHSAYEREYQADQPRRTELVARFLAKAEGISALDTTNVHPPLVAFMDDLVDLARDARATLGNEHQDLELAMEKDRKVRGQGIFGFAASIQRVHYDDALGRYAKLWNQVQEKFDALQKRWSKLQVEIPEHFPEASERLFELYGDSIYTPDDPSLFDIDLTPSSTPTTQDTAAFLLRALEQPYYTALVDVAVLRRSFDIDVMLHVRAHAKRVREAHTGNVSEAGTIVGRGLLAFYGYGYSVHRLQERKIPWGSQVRRDLLPPLMFPELFFHKKVFMGTVRLRSQREITASGLELLDRTVQAATDAIREVVAEDPSYLERLEKGFRETFDRPLDLNG